MRKVLLLEKVRDPSANSEPVVGNGDRCVPGDDSNCGDEGPAIKAKLAHPKGVYRNHRRFNLKTIICKIFMLP